MNGAHLVAFVSGLVFTNWSDYLAEVILVDRCKWLLHLSTKVSILLLDYHVLLVIARLHSLVSLLVIVWHLLVVVGVIGALSAIV